MKRARLPYAFLWGSLFFLYLPIIILVVNSFNSSRFGGVWGGGSLKWYIQLFREEAMWHALYNSLIVGISSATLATFLGSTAAFVLFRHRSTFHTYFYALILSPLLLPDIFIGISLLLLFFLLGFSLNLFSVFFAHTTFCLSYVAFLMLGRLENFDLSLIEAAEDLGASFIVTVRKVLFPLLTPTLLSAALFSFTLSFDDYIITSFVLGPGNATLPIYIFGMIKYGSTPLVNALSTLILGATVLFVSLSLFLGKGKTFS